MGIAGSQCTAVDEGSRGVLNPGDQVKVNLSACGDVLVTRDCFLLIEKNFSNRRKSFIAGTS